MSAAYGVPSRIRFMHLFALAPIALLALAGCPLPPGPVIVLPPGTLAPGLALVVEDVVIPADLRPEVIFRLEDEAGNAIALAELRDARFILGYLEEPAAGSTARWLSYTTVIEDPDRVPNSGDEAVQATTDSARLGGISRNDDGTYTYKFATVLPADYDDAAPHQLSGQFTRFYPVDGKTYPFNLVYRFVPDGSKQGMDIAGRDIVNTETCNQCHTRLAVHGGGRREIQYCIMCHNTQSSDAQSGNSVDFAQMIHKIHRGVDLPSVQDGEPYQIIGFGNSVHDYSHVQFPQDVRNCTVCHQGEPDSDVHMMNPTLEGCASCHDRTWFGHPGQTPEGFTNHVGGQHTNNTLCALCHTPTAPGSSPITEAHTLPWESDSAPGLSFEITNVAVQPVDGGNQVSLTFFALDRNGNPYTNFSDFNSVAANVAWPATDYAQNVRESVYATANGTLVSNANGSHTYTFRQLFPDTGDTFAAAMEGRVNYQFRGAAYRQGPSDNGQVFFTIDGSQPVMRRAVVDDAKCNACHGEIRAHGEQRFGTSLCIMCHNVNQTDAARRPADAMPPASVNFKDMIHRIHTGEDLNGPYTVYGFGGAAHDFTHVAFPGLRQECGICHVSGSTNLPLPDGTLPTTVSLGGEIVHQTPPETAACTTCHDSLFTGVHAFLQTDAMGVESCAVCHGPGAAFAVDAAHALAP